MYISQTRTVAQQNRFSISKAELWQKGTYACTMLINASMYILIARILPAASLGSYLFVHWLASIAVPAIGVGTSMLTSRRVVDIQSRETPPLAAGVFYFLWYRQHRRVLCYCAIYVLLAVPLSKLFPACTPELILLAGLTMLPLLLSSVAGTALRSLRRADLLTMLNLFCALTTLLLVIVAAQADDQLVAALFLASALASTLTLIVAVLCIMRLLPLERARQPGVFLKERILHSIGHAWYPFLLDTIIWQRSELLLVAYWYSPAQVGYYILATLISTGCMSLAPYLFTSWVLPLRLRYRPEQRYWNAYDAFIKTTCDILFLTIPICALLILLCPSLIELCLGASYLPSVHPLRIMLIATACGSIATVSMTHIANQGLKSIQSKLNTAVALLKIILAIPLIAQWGITGAAMASTLAQCSAAFIAIFMCHKLLKKHETAVPKK